MSQALNPAQISVLNSQQNLPLVARFAVAFAVTVTKWDTYWRTRRNLKTLDRHMLKDIGLDRPAALAEASKPFWQD